MSDPVTGSVAGSVAGVQPGECAFTDADGARELDVDASYALAWAMP